MKIICILIKRYRFLRYVISGGLAFICEYGSYLILYYVFHARINIAADVSYFIGLIFSFLLNRQWVFAANHVNGRIFRRQLISYGILVLINATFTNFAILRLHHYGLKPYLAKLVTILIIVSWNYVIYKYVIFINNHNSAGVIDEHIPSSD